ncbi:hypothetical protein BV20DRAFT_372742 [Pilatotrama ljubarskyi]|nr:hypothetical protein BV20DRAFT_372742 [Pilatotrama ljubarskyi]
MSWFYTYRLCTSVVVFGLAIGVTALTVHTVYSNTYARLDADRHFDVLYARIAVGAGIFTAIEVLLQLLRDCCHRPFPIVYELVWSSVASIAWIAVAIITLVQNGKNFQDSACDDPNSTANDVCTDAWVMVLLSALVAALYILYALVLGFVAWVAVKRGKPMWLYPVPRGSTPKAAAKDGDPPEV